MFKLFENEVVVRELARLESLIGTDGGRCVEYDISILKEGLSTIEEKIFHNNEDFAMIECNMWHECHDSLHDILYALRLDIDDEKSIYDEYNFCIVREEKLDEKN